MLLDTQGGILLTNDGNAILREVDVSHPAAKAMKNLSQAQDENVGDGTISVVILAGEILHVSESLLEKGFYPAIINKTYIHALGHAINIMNDMSVPIAAQDKEQMMKTIKSCIGTKFTQQFGNLIAELAFDAVNSIIVELSNCQKEIDIKKYAKVEKIPG